MKVLVIKKRVLTSNLCGGVPFQYSYTCSIGQLKLLKGNSTEDVSLGIWNFESFKIAVLQIPPEKCLKLCFLQVYGFSIAILLL